MKSKTMTTKKDIIQLILDDHKPLKRLIKILKDSDTDAHDRKMAFEEFAPLLSVHAKSEEDVVYVYMKGEEELRMEGFEGDIEHSLADQLIQQIQSTQDEDEWSARIKVLAELVEHHIKEEEEDQFPDLKKHSSATDRIAMGEEYLEKKSYFENEDMPKIKKQSEVSHAV